jgi:uncharacterized membrane protein
VNIKPVIAAVFGVVILVCLWFARKAWKEKQYADIIPLAFVGIVLSIICCSGVLS